MSSGRKVAAFLLLTVMGVFYSFSMIQTKYLTWEVTAKQPPPARFHQYVVDTPGCQIPILDPFDPSVVHLIKDMGDLHCGSKPPLVVLDGLRKIRVRVDKEVSKVYGAIKCYYKTITRKTENKFKTSGRVFFNRTLLNITSEFIVVECLNVKKKVVFTDFFPFIQRKAETESRVQKAKTSWKNKPNVERFNVIILGLDSVSKNQFLRHMQKTHAYIKENLVHVDLQGYNKVGKNTYPNMMPFLTGKDERSVNDTTKVPANVLPLIWKEFARDGYRTLFSEDIPTISIFNWARKGFDRPPTDYYLRPFSWAVQQSPLVKRGKRGCNNHRPEIEVILKWTEDLFDVFPHDPLFAFNFFTRLSHDNFNELSFQDKPIKNFLKRLNDKGHLNNTIIIFFGDHGFRFGNIRSTYVGRMEDKLPFAFLLLPHCLPDKYPQLYQNLQTNQHRLSTPYDMYGTLSYILNFTGKTYAPDPSERIVSLISSEVPENRTCEDAGIEQHFCACVSRQQVDVKDSHVQKAAQLIVKAINTILHSKAPGMCAELTVRTVHEATVEVVGTGEHSRKDNSANFQVTVEVEPSKGIFEGVVWYYEDKKKYTVDKTIERVNMYGNQSICVNENLLKPYCFC